VKLCRPIFKENAFNCLLNFAKEVKEFVPSVLFSVVRQTLSEEELIACEKHAEEAGVTLKIREYISN
jgi:hypothetical protein